MLIMKMIGCVLVITSSAGMGLYFSAVLKSRIDELKELKKIVLLLRGNIRYTNTPLPEAMESISKRYEGSFNTFLHIVIEQLQNLSGATLSDIWRNAVEKGLKGFSLTKLDKESLLNFGSNLGYLDKDMQLGTIDLYIAQLEAEIEEATRTAKEKSYLYKSLGILGGIFISIIML